jgi:hypothetical protein
MSREEVGLTPKRFEQNRVRTDSQNQGNTGSRLTANALEQNIVKTDD